MSSAKKNITILLFLFFLSVNSITYAKTIEEQLIDSGFSNLLLEAKDNFGKKGVKRKSKKQIVLDMNEKIKVQRNKSRSEYLKSEPEIINNQQIEQNITDENTPADKDSNETWEEETDKQKQPAKSQNKKTAGITSWDFEKEAETFFEDLSDDFAMKEKKKYKKQKNIKNNTVLKNPALRQKNIIDELDERDIKPIKKRKRQKKAKARILAREISQELDLLETSDYYRKKLFPQTTNGLGGGFYVYDAFTRNKGAIGFGGSIEFIEFDRIGEFKIASSNQLQQYKIPLVFSYGVTRRSEFSFSIPFISYSHNIATVGQAINNIIKLSKSGIGDMEIAYKYNIRGNRARRNGTAWILSLKLPTGSTTFDDTTTNKDYYTTISQLTASIPNNNQFYFYPHDLINLGTGTTDITLMGVISKNLPKIKWDLNLGITMSSNMKDNPFTNNFDESGLDLGGTIFSFRSQYQFAQKATGMLEYYSFTSQQMKMKADLVLGVKYRLNNTMIMSLALPVGLSHDSSWGYSYKILTSMKMMF